MAHTGAVLGLVALLFAAWGVYLGGLASQQRMACKGMVPLGFEETECKKVYRFEWWIFSYEFFIFVGLAAVTAAGLLNRFKASFVGLFAIATIFYTMCANTAFDRLDSLDEREVTGQHLYSQRTMLAGLIMTAVVNFFITIAVGIEEVPAPAHQGPAKEANPV